MNVKASIYITELSCRMDSKGKVAQVAYPNIVFCVDNFEDIFSQIFTSEQGQKVAVQLLATNDVSKAIIVNFKQHTHVYDIVVCSLSLSLSLLESDP